MVTQKQFEQFKKHVKMFIKKHNKIFTGEDAEFKTPLSDVDESIFLRGKTLIISGEEGNRFSSYFVDYYYQNSFYKMSDYLEKKGWYLEWNDPGSVHVYKE